MQGFGMGRYRPPDSDPRREPFNQSHHLAARARKLQSHGILVVRFELPFNVICLSCDAHLAQGRRINAEKKQVGEYLNTKIWGFGCKCVCGHRFEIRTDPQNAQYVVESGARKQVQEWDPEENGGHPVYDTQAKHREGEGEDGGPQDAFAKLEKEQKLKFKAKARQARIAELERHSEKQWSDPYTLNSNLRKTFRKAKRKRTAQIEADIDLKRRIGWNDEKALIQPSPSASERDGKLWREKTASVKHNKMKEKVLTAAQRLQATLIANSRKKANPFLQQSNKSTSSTMPNGDEGRLIQSSSSSSPSAERI
ncbi:related to YJU2 - essential protein required for pre-mRNA splicing [Melanopsichium pennsylvanicum]|uniref:Related to YJU2 - essential protein required for pre-mRNA splicing n=2 Tax=Melanopsichium pennsylvanicum TaxID=63383 RepID=A0AAJ4XQJ6_9BASI|nr:conserved hypothetical protein [Melanopsichium pennsylvanicum 4]SNX85283.1 related to YJU2 - essential protein required for pre-mRNA splicing [Melanopsichium pennsylvanicum]